MPAGMRESTFVKNFGMPTGLDEQYTWMSLATLIVFVLIAWELYKSRKATLALAATPEGVVVPVEVAGKDGEEKGRDDVPGTAAMVAVPPRSPAGKNKNKKKRNRK
jgi:hypothetical protein